MRQRAAEAAPIFSQASLLDLYNQIITEPYNIGDIRSWPRFVDAVRKPFDDAQEGIRAAPGVRILRPNRIVSFIRGADPRDLALYPRP